MSYARLRKIALLRGLPDRELKRVHAIATTQDFPSGSLIFSKSDSAEAMFLVLGGRVKIFCYSSARKRKTFAYLGPGEFFGEMAIISDKGRTASAQAVEPTRLMIIHKKDFKRLLLSDAKLCYALLQAVSERLRRADEEIESLLFRNILGRVSKTLFDLCQASGRKVSGGVQLKDRYTHQELADLVGTTREPLSRALGILRRADVVDARKGLILIRDPQKLDYLAHAAMPDN